MTCTQVIFPYSKNKTKKSVGLYTQPGMLLLGLPPQSPAPVMTSTPFWETGVAWTASQMLQASPPEFYQLTLGIFSRSWKLELSLGPKEVKQSLLARQTQNSMRRSHQHQPSSLWALVPGCQSCPAARRATRSSGTDGLQP